jgi:hypothetical protein
MSRCWEGWRSPLCATQTAYQGQGIDVLFPLVSRCWEQWSSPLCVTQTVYQGQGIEILFPLCAGAGNGGIVHSVRHKHISGAGH